MSFSLAQLFDQMDRIPESIVMGSMAELFDTGRRGIFSDKFMPYSDIKELGYSGFKRIVQGLYELDPNFVNQNSDELGDLLDRATELTRRVQSGDVDLTAVLNPNPQITTQERESQNDSASIRTGQLDDQWGRDQYA